MRFEQLLLASFGRFRDVRLDLSRGAPGGLHVIFGENEAGKSTSLRAVQALLFGIPSATVDAHTFPLNELRVGAEISNRDGSRVVFRRRGRGATLIDAHGDPIEERFLSDALGGLDQRSFQTRFGLDQVELERGAQALLGGTEEGLFAAGAAGADLRRVLGQLREESEGLYSRRGRVKPLNQAAERYREALRAQSSVVRSAEAYLDQERATERLSAELRGYEEARRRARLEHIELSRLGSMLSQLGERRALRETLQQLARELPKGPVEPETRARRLELEAALRESELLLASVRSTISALVRELAPLEERAPARVAILRFEAELSGLKERIGSARNARGALPRLEARKQAALSQVARVLRAGLLDLPGLAAAEEGRATADFLARVTAAMPPKPLQKTLRTLAGEHRKLEHDLRAKRTEVARGKVLLDEPQAPTSRLAPDAIGLLAARLAEGQSVVHEEREAKEWRGRARATEMELAALMASLGLPDSARLDRARFRRATELSRQLPRLVELWTDLEHAFARENEKALERAQLEAEKESLGGGQPLPTTEALLQARAARDALVGELENCPQDLAARSARELGATLRESVQRSDRLADVLRLDSERIARLTELSARSARLAQELERERDRRAEKERAQAELEATLAPLWSFLAIDAPQGARPTERLGERCVGLVRVEELEARLAQEESCRDATERRLAECRTQLEQALSAAGEAPPKGAPLPFLLERGQAVLAEQRNREQEQALAAERRRGWLSRFQAEKEALEGMEQAERDCLERLRTALGRLGAGAAGPLNGELSASDWREDLEALLDAWDACLVPLTEARGHEQRVEGILRDAAELELEVRRWLSEAAPDLLGAEPLAAAAELVARFEEAQKVEIEVRRRRAELVLQRQKEQELEATRERARAGLEELLLGVGVDSLDVLRIREELSDTFRQARLRERELESSLLEKAGGASLAELERHAANTTHAAVFARIEELNEEIDNLNDALSLGEGELRSLELALERFKSPDAAEARQLVAHRGEEVKQLLRRHLTLRVAHEWLSRAMAEYSERFAGPLTARASVLFERLTRGRYERLRPDPNQKFLEVIGGGRRLQVEELSRGTRAQLYFALRIASLELYFAEHPAFPLVFDDLFVDFDDERTAAAFEILGELAERTQVLYFTHLGRDVERAVDVVPQGRVFTHALPGTPLGLEEGAALVSKARSR